MPHAPSRSIRRTRMAPVVALVVALCLAAYWALTTTGGPATVPRATTSAPAATAAPVTPAPPAEPVTPAPGTTLGLLHSLPVKGRAPRTGYDREDGFGSPWLDVDRNGCDTRNDILARDLTATVLSGPCRVMSGTLADPYTSAAIPFLRGDTTSALVQIDHVVALSNAWQTGAQQLTAEQRRLLANDPRNLLAVDGGANSSKGDGDAATWLPANRAFRCEYVSLQVEVKSAYALWVTPAEREAIERVLGACGEGR